MKKEFLLAVLIGVMPLSLMAQDDDLYFTPKKAAEMNSNADKVSEKPAYYAGSNRDVDEYNRRGKFWSHYQKIGTDKDGNDIIQFQKGNGVYPDSTYIDTTFVGKYYDTMVDDDYRYTSRMSRWDGFYDPWFYSYRWGFGPYWRGWYDPWYYGYGGWYGSWYGGYAGWYNPWYYGYGGWYDPWYYGYGWGPYYGWYGYPWGGYVSYSRPAGRTYNSWSGYGSNNAAYRTGTFGGRSTNNGRRYGSNSRAYSRASGSNRSVFGGRSTSTPSNRSYTPSRSGGSFGGGSSSSGGSFGGSSRSSGGGSFGGGHVSGGGRFGGGRR